jgi:5-methylthioadenosine/S-adenosylhomocysteine deaminase
MANIAIQNVLVDGERRDIVICGNRIESVTPAGKNTEKTLDGCDIIDGSRLAAFPSLTNMHTHAAMSLFRGYGDDLPLEQWLQEKIWPNEQNLDAEIVYWGSRLACLEMIKSGTTCFNDMYFYQFETARAARKMGIRATVALTFFDQFDPRKAEQVKIDCRNFEKDIAREPSSDLIGYAIAPHAVYTVSGASLNWAADFAREHGFPCHIHAAESPTECNNSAKDFGATPVRYLESLGVLAENTIVAHGVWLDDEEVRMLGEHRCTVVHNPNSNLKLASGHAFRYNELRDAGANVCLGTDGCSSSNNLDIIEAMKVMSLLQKGWRLDPTALPTKEVLQVASRNGFAALGIDAGEIAPRRLADIMLVDLDNIAFVPDNNTTSNLVYASHGDCVDTVICNGRVVMRHRHVDGEQEIIDNARRVVHKLITH